MLGGVGIRGGADCALVPAQAPVLLNELRSTWDMQPPAVATDDSAATAQHAHSSDCHRGLTEWQSP